jgi:non-heme chloroperoxidase
MICAATGLSEAPLEPGHYTDGQLWAKDVAAIIEELHLDRPVLVGWSYGAFVICDFVRTYGQDQITAIDFVEGAVKLGEAAFGTLIGPGFLDHFVGAQPTTYPPTSRPCSRSCERASSSQCRTTTCRRRRAGTRWCRLPSAPIWRPARLTAMTC